MSGKRELLDAVAGLFEYPGRDFAARVARCRALAEERSPGRGALLAELEERVRGLTPGEVEEMFTRTFEINPVCALEVGWHVYGEEYARGALLVRLRQELRRHRIPELTELPDHLMHVLRLLGRLEPALADDLAGRYVLPALGKMIAGTAGKECPYLGLLEMTRDIVRDEHDATEIEPQAKRTEPPGSRQRLPVLRPLGGHGVCGAGAAGRVMGEAEHGAE